MPLENTDNTPATDGGQSGLNALEAALFTPAAPMEAPPAAPAATPPPAPVAETPPAAEPKATPAAPTKGKTPLAEVEDEDPALNLPIDQVEYEDPEPAVTPKDKAGYVIQQYKEEIKSKWKPQVAALEETVKQKDARLAELEAFSKERDELNERVKTYEAEMSITKLENTPAFKKEVAEPEARIVASALKIIEHYGMDEKAIFAALEEPDALKRSAAFKAATSGLDVDGEHSYELRKLADEAQIVIKRRGELYQNADAALAELSAKAEQEAAAQAITRAEERGKATDLVTGQLAKKLPFVRELVDEALLKSVKDTDPDSLDTANKAYNHLAGLTLPKLAKAYAKLVAERDSMADEIASYNKTNPRVDGGLGRTSPGDAKPKTLEEALLAAAR